MSEAAVDDLLKFFRLALPEENNVATSAYKFRKRNEQCVLKYNHLQVCPTCHEAVAEKELVCQNNDCNMEGEKVDPIKFFVLPLRPQIQRLLKGKNISVIV